MLLGHVAHLHVLVGQLEAVEMLHGPLDVLHLHVRDENIALGSVRLLILISWML